MNWPGMVLEPVIYRGDPSLLEGHPVRDRLVVDLPVRGGVHTPQTDAILDVPSRVRRPLTGQPPLPGLPPPSG